MKSWYHLDSSAQVFVRSWLSVFAVTTPRVSANVEIANRMSQLTSALLPTPWPLETSSSITVPRSAPARSLAPIRSSCSACHTSGPASFSSALPGWPHGNAQRTKPSGSCWNCASIPNSSSNAVPLIDAAATVAALTGMAPALFGVVEEPPRCPGSCQPLRPPCSFQMTLVWATERRPSDRHSHPGIPGHAVEQRAVDAHHRPGLRVAAVGARELAGGCGVDRALRPHGAGLLTGPARLPNARRLIAKLLRLLVAHQGAAEGARLGRCHRGSPVGSWGWVAGISSRR